MHHLVMVVALRCDSLLFFQQDMIGREVDARTVKRIVTAFNEYFISDDLIN